MNIYIVFLSILKLLLNDSQLEFFQHYTQENLVKNAIVHGKGLNNQKYANACSTHEATEGVVLIIDMWHDYTVPCGGDTHVTAVYFIYSNFTVYT